MDEGRGAMVKAMATLRPLVDTRSGTPPRVSHKREASSSRGRTSMASIGQDTLRARRILAVEGREYDYFAIPAVAPALGELTRLPTSLKILLENVLRCEDGRTVKVEDAHAFAAWLA